MMVTTINVTTKLVGRFLYLMVTGLHRTYDAAFGKTFRWPPGNLTRDLAQQNKHTFQTLGHGGGENITNKQFTKKKLMSLLTVIKHTSFRNIQFGRNLYTPTHMYRILF